jgi:hypothetical protein
MAQEAFNSTNNINIPHNISMWFQRDFAGNFQEFGDLVVDGVSLTPEFAEFRSYRNGIKALRKRLFTNRSATVTATLNEPNIRTFERVLFGTSPSSGSSVTAYEGQHLTIKDIGSGNLGVELADANETDFGNITVTAIYAATDVLEATNMIPSNVLPDTDGKVDFTDTDFTVGDIVYVRYEHTQGSMFSTEIFGATDATVEGAAQLQARNLQGGVIQIWELASVGLAPNGDLSYPVDTTQSIPVILSLQERAGSFGTLYTK